MLSIPWLSDGLENIPVDEEGLDLNKFDWLLLLFPEENKPVDFIGEDEENKELPVLLFFENKLFDPRFDVVIAVLNKLFELLFYIGLVVEGEDEFAALLNKEFEFIFELFFD